MPPTEARTAWSMRRTLCKPRTPCCACQYQFSIVCQQRQCQHQAAMESSSLSRQQTT
jgi:hypothetical protein